MASSNSSLKIQCALTGNPTKLKGYGGTLLLVDQGKARAVAGRDVARSVSPITRVCSGNILRRMSISPWRESQVGKFRLDFWDGFRKPFTLKTLKRLEIVLTQQTSRLLRSSSYGLAKGRKENTAGP